MAAVAGVRTLPYDWYADSAVLRLEQERIFARSWQYAARLDQVAEERCDRSLFLIVGAGEHVDGAQSARRDLRAECSCRQHGC